MYHCQNFRQMSSCTSHLSQRGPAPSSLRGSAYGGASKAVAVLVLLRGSWGESFVAAPIADLSRSLCLLLSIASCAALPPACALALAPALHYSAYRHQRVAVLLPCPSRCAGPCLLARVRRLTAIACGVRQNNSLPLRGTASRSFVSPLPPGHVPETSPQKCVLM